MQIGIPAETRAGETRVAATPETVKKLVAGGHHKVLVQTGAGVAAAIPDQAFAEAGATIVGSAAEVFGQSDIILKVRALTQEEIGLTKSGAIVIGLLNPYDTAGIEAMAAKGITGFALEWLPRITRAQAMDVLSSQANIAGYKAVLMAANLSPRLFPMLTTAAGTIRPAKVVVIGAGVAGLQAIATARRLGAIVEAYDVRSATKEQCESLGARFIETGVTAEGAGGYARELTEEEKAQQARVLANHIAEADAVISTAAVPGRPAPKIIDTATVKRMKRGAVIVDLAAETGGNCELTRPGATVEHNGVLIHGPRNVPSTAAVHASEMYARNLYNLLTLLIKDGQLTLDFDDEVIRDSCLTHAGEIRHEPTRQRLQGEN